MVTDNLPEEEREQQAEQNGELHGVTDTNKQSEGSLCTEIENSDQFSASSSNCEKNFKLHQTMKENVFSIV